YRIAALRCATFVPNLQSAQVSCLAGDSLCSWTYTPLKFLLKRGHRTNLTKAMMVVSTTTSGRAPRLNSRTRVSIQTNMQIMKIVESINKPPGCPFATVASDSSLAEEA